MTDAELILWLRLEDTSLTDFAADRIEALIEESGRRLALARSEGVARVEQFERTEALTEQLAAARQDAKEAEAYAEELEVNLATAVELALKECPFRWGTPRYDEWWQDRRTIIALLTEKPHDRA